MIYILIIDPAVKLYTVQLEGPTFENKTGDFERLCNGLEREYGLKDLTIDILTLRQLPMALRQEKWLVTVSVWNDKEIVRVRPGRIRGLLRHSD